MKKLLLNLLVIGVVACSHNATAQTNTLGDQFKSTTMGFVDSVTTATNWNAHVEYLYLEAFKNHNGVRVGFDYLYGPSMYSTLSLCIADGTVYGMTGNFGIKHTWDIGGKGKFLVSTAAKVGVGETLSGMTFGTFVVPGKSANSGQFFGTFGSDVILSFPTMKYMPDVLLGYEKWSNLSGNVYSAGLHWPLSTFTNLL